MDLHLASFGFLRSRKDWESDGDFTLQAEILELMKNSKNTEAFLSLKDFNDGVRKDLADSILRKAGWLSFGWELDEERVKGLGGIDDADKASLIVNEGVIKDGGNKVQNHRIRGSGAASSSANRSHTVIPFSKSIEMEAEEPCNGGISNQLENERNKDELHHSDPTDSGQGGSPDDPQKLSDVWEFQENVQDRMHSIRAKLSVLKGKMTLEIIDAQKMLEGMQKRIEASNLLCPTCILWPSSASELLLAGLFDGWSTQVGELEHILQKVGKEALAGVSNTWVWLDCFSEIYDSFILSNVCSGGALYLVFGFFVGLIGNSGPAPSVTINGYRAIDIYRMICRVQPRGNDDSTDEDEEDDEEWDPLVIPVRLQSYGLLSYVSPDVYDSKESLHEKITSVFHVFVFVVLRRSPRRVPRQIRYKNRSNEVIDTSNLSYQELKTQLARVTIICDLLSTVGH